VTFCPGFANVRPVVSTVLSTSSVDGMTETQLVVRVCVRHATDATDHKRRMQIHNATTRTPTNAKINDARRDRVLTNCHTHNMKHDGSGKRSSFNLTQQNNSNYNHCDKSTLLSQRTACDHVNVSAFG